MSADARPSARPDACDVALRREHMAKTLREAYARWRREGRDRSK